ncbi:glycosyltransferase [Synechococcus sp. NB0720_010]|uniref:glycosyltransferase n=1 Tax=Synechococcus sp. NB0720_010 TaxID=2907159 RepID=UPI001FFA4AA6|nr:glycosyltransferase [Synechococcus sp. NB0720_010]UPH89124.1 glycosyltransferase [Synechococcus sp. NB0720_010]
MARLLVVVPTLNSFAVLNNLVKSVLNQDFQDWRLIFVDGPSTSAHRAWLENCSTLDPRFNWIEQRPLSHGIYGAMNSGFDLAYHDECILFWGSDDWAPSPTVFSHIMSTYDSSFPRPDLLIARGSYIHASSRRGRLVSFCPPLSLSAGTFRRYLLNGRTPPHQATLFAPGARKFVSSYDQTYKLAADLDFFLRISAFSQLHVKSIDLDVVFMSSGGVSAKHNFRRTYEVFRAYFSAFGIVWILPFILRYLLRIFSFLGSLELF